MGRSSNVQGAVRRDRCRHPTLSPLSALAASLLIGCVLATPVPALPSPDTPATSGAREPASASLPTSLDDLSPAERERLFAGETVVRMEGAEDEIGEGRAWRVLEAPAERLFRAVADWRHYSEFFPFVVESDAEVAADGSVLARQRIDLPFPFTDRTFAATTRRSVGASEATGTGDSAARDTSPPDTSSTAPRGAATGPDLPAYHVSWSHVPGSGNVTANSGAWTLTPLAPGRTLVELRLFSDTGPPVPASLQRRALAETLPWALDGLRQHVNRCRYDRPVHPSCGEEPPFPAVEDAGDQGDPF